MHRGSAYLICRLEMQMIFHFSLLNSAENLRDFSRLLGDLLCHFRVIALTFSSFHRDRFEINTFLKEDTTLPEKV